MKGAAMLATLQALGVMPPFLVVRQSVEAARAMHPGRSSGATRNWKPLPVVRLHREKQATDPAGQKAQNPERKKSA
jgi:hypothetical protein